MIVRVLQWVATLVVAAVGFVAGVDVAGAHTYPTDIGRVQIELRLDLPGNAVVVEVPQAHYAARLHPFHAPIEWRARTVQLNARGRALVRRHRLLDLANIVLAGRSAVLHSAARSFLYGAAGAVLLALVMALAFAIAFGGLLTRLVVALFAVGPLLVAGGVAYLAAGSGVA